MDELEKAKRVARWRANRTRERISAAFWFLSFAPALFFPQDKESMEAAILLGVVVVCLIFSVGLTIYLHEITSACPLCNRKFADSEEYGFGDSPGLSLTDTVENCPFCGEKLDENRAIEYKSGDEEDRLS